MPTVLLTRIQGAGMDRTIDSTTVHFVEHGSGTAVVGLQALTTWSRSWASSSPGVPPVWSCCSATLLWCLPRPRSRRLPPGADRRPGYAGAVGLLDRYPDATLAVVDEAGHALVHERPELFGAFLHDWLDRGHSTQT